MEEEENSPIVSGDVEIIIIKLEPTEDFLDDEDFLMQEGSHLQINEIEGNTENDFYENPPENEVPVTSEVNSSNIIQIPFSLENYFGDNDDANLNNLIEANHLACSYCKIVFPTEKILHEHLIVHIDINRMGCNICDKDLNIAEKYQLHVMAITRQSIYYCDLCKKSCAGVVRSKDQTRPAGKAYACHDCEIQLTGKLCNLSGLFPNIQLNRKFFNHEPVLQSSNKRSDIVEMEIKVNGSRLNSDNFLHRCQYCDAFFAQPVTLSRHLRVRHNLSRSKINAIRNANVSNDETEGNMIKCKDCEVVVSEEKDLARHSEQTHVEHEPSKNSESSETQILPKNKFKCNQRDVLYSENINLSKHLRQKRRKRKQKFTCKVCLKQFRLQRCYNNHVNFHENTKNYVCCSCELRFLSKYKLQQHMKIHDLEKKEDKRKYKCAKKTLTDVSLKRSLRRTRLRNS